MCVYKTVGDAGESYMWEACAGGGGGGGEPVVEIVDGYREQYDEWRDGEMEKVESFEECALVLELEMLTWDGVPTWGV